VKTKVLELIKKAIKKNVEELLPKNEDAVRIASPV